MFIVILFLPNSNYGKHSRFFTVLLWSAYNLSVRIVYCIRTFIETSYNGITLVSKTKDGSSILSVSAINQSVLVCRLVCEILHIVKSMEIFFNIVLLVTLF